MQILTPLRSPNGGNRENHENWPIFTQFHVFWWISPKIGDFHGISWKWPKKERNPPFRVPGTLWKAFELLLFLLRARHGPLFTLPDLHFTPFYQNSMKMGEIPLKSIKISENGVNRVPGGATRPRSSQNVTIIKPFAASRAARDSHFSDFCT